MCSYRCAYLAIWDTCITIRHFRHRQGWACSAAAQAQHRQEPFAEPKLLVDARCEHAISRGTILEQGNKMNTTEAAHALPARGAER